MSLIFSFLYTFTGSILVLRIIPHYWRTRKGVSLTLAALLFLVTIGVIFAAPFPVETLILKWFIPFSLILLFFLWYAKLELKWDEELREEARKLSQAFYE